MPSAFSALQTASAASRVSPATKRVEILRAAAEVSIIRRNCFWRERNSKNLRTNPRLTPRMLDCASGARNQGNKRKTRRYPLSAVLQHRSGAEPSQRAYGLDHADGQAGAAALPRVRKTVLCARSGPEQDQAVLSARTWPDRKDSCRHKKKRTPERPLYPTP